MSKGTTTTAGKSAANPLHDALREIKRAVDKLVKQRTSAEQRRAELNARRAFLYDQPVSRQDVWQFFGELIDRRSKAFENRVLSFDLLGKLADPVRYTGRSDKGPSPLNFEDIEYVLGRGRSDGKKRGDQVDDMGVRLVVLPIHSSFEWWPYFFLGDAMKTKLGELLGMETPAEGGDIAADSINSRRAELAVIEAELQQLEKDLSRIQSEIDALALPAPEASIVEPASEHAESATTDDDALRAMWAERLGIDPDKERERFEHEMKRTSENSRRMAEGQH